MGKSSYKKFKKQEKARVKLKGNKTLLPKGQNVTDTSFKVKKIIVKEQLKKHSEYEILTRKHLSIKELISRLSHHNVTMRQDALSGLKELLSAHSSDVILTNFSPLLQTTMSLTVDKESDVRSETVKLLSLIFEKVSEQELAPLFPVVVCHLTCAMTHIEPSVRADSLRLLDAMLATLPVLTAKHTPTLLPHFLDLISQRGGDGGMARTLSLHLDGRFTSETWRARVIGRLNRLFSVIVGCTKKDTTTSERSVCWSLDKYVYLGLFCPLTSGTSNTEDIASLPMKEYSDMLLPLLLDTFVEAVPKQDSDETQTACVIGADTAALLQSIVEVILHIWNLLKYSSNSGMLVEWFRETWSKLLVSRLLRGRFPYTVSAPGSRKRQREVDKMQVILQVSRDLSLDQCCSLLNLRLCLLAFLLSPPGDLWTHCIQYIKRTLRGAGSVRPEESEVLYQCLEAASDRPLDVAAASDQPSLLGVLARCDILNSINKPVNKKAFTFLTSVALRPTHHLHQDKHFISWLDSLPGFLCKPSVPLPIVRSIAAIATRNLPAFSNSLDGWIEAILENLLDLRVSGDPNGDGKRLIVGLVYWVTDWDPGVVQVVKQLIDKLGPQLTKHLAQVLRLKADSTENEEIKKALESFLL